MTIAERIQKLLESEGITAAQFADIIGVQRSSISHIMSSRNNPSFEFIQKIMIHFSKIDPSWLVLGVGNIYKQEKQTTLFDNDKPEINKNPTKEQPIIAKNQLQELPLQVAAKSSPEPLLFNQEKKIVSTVNISDNEKEVIKIIEFYSDQTFAIYQPKK